ncbi:MerR family DNA-binding transcriptional regulator [Streptomyces indicus]|uniref:MerR family DNA-binding transcriptional regulator n=1 Tax=Streptomyces indicus TaxID=417292 RepID=UPI000D1AD499
MPRLNNNFLTTAQAAEAAGVQPTTLRQWARRGYLKPVRIPGSRSSWWRELDVLTVERETRRRGGRRAG